MSYDTGRLRQPLHPTIQSLLFERPLGRADREEPQWVAELDLITTVDKAHLVMLAEQSIAPTATVGTLLRAIEELRRTRFADLADVPVPRGLYLAYESHMADRVGIEDAGVLHTGRSRNDLSSTVLRLRLREPFRRLTREMLGLAATLLRLAELHGAVTMPAHTHGQPAVPVTYGHYCLGVAAALSRDAEALLDAGRHLDRSPLGAGAVGGTTIPIVPERTSRLLGFDSTFENSIDAVASRDVVLRLLAAASITGVLLDRLARDLLMWSTDEFGFLRVPEDVAGSSSMMPQKRNPFALEHIQGKSASPLGALTSAAAAGRGSSFTNSIAVGTESVSHVWSALRDLTDALTLTRLFVERAEPDGESMLRRAVRGHTTATALAERMVGAGVPFRTAHRRVGATVRAALEQDESLEATAGRELAGCVPGLQLEGLDPSSVAAAAEHGGGPGPTAAGSARRAIREQWLGHARRFAAQRRQWRRADEELEHAVAAVKDT